MDSGGKHRFKVMKSPSNFYVFKTIVFRLDILSNNRVYRYFGVCKPISSLYSKKKKSRKRTSSVGTLWSQYNFYAFSRTKKLSCAFQGNDSNDTYLIALYVVKGRSRSVDG